MLKKIKKLSKALEWVVFIVLLGILGLVVSPYLPFKNLPKSFVVVSGSMEPAIHTGSIVFVHTVDPKTIKKGDIIAFTSPSNSKDTILHRVDFISSTNPLQFKTKGDNNNAVDAWDVMDVGVKGVYFGAIPYLGNAAAFIRQPLGFSLVIILPALLFVISQILNIKKAISEEIDRKVAQTLKSTKKSKSTGINLNSFTLFIALVSTLISLSTFQVIKASFSDTVTISGINLSVADFTKPSIPTNLKWSNPDVSCGGYTNSYTITPDWDDSFDSSGVTKYQYEATFFKTGGNLVWPTFVYSSSYNGVFNQGEGVYSFRVRAYGTDGNISDWSNSCSITYDKTAPVSIITSPVNSGNNQIGISISSWDGKIGGTATDSLSGVDRVEISIQKDSDKFWSGTDWVLGSEGSTRVLAIGTTNWSYQIPGVISSGFYRIISHAIDKTNNVENSATIEFSYNEAKKTLTPVTEPDFSVNLDRTSHHLSFVTANYPAAAINYEVLYQNSAGEQGIAGVIPSTDLVGGVISRDFYLGTCTTGGTCTPDIVAVGSSLSVSLNSQIKTVVY